jgi:hypothetical protein
MYAIVNREKYPSAVDAQRDTPHSTRVLTKEGALMRTSSQFH